MKLLFQQYKRIRTWWLRECQCPHNQNEIYPFVQCHILDHPKLHHQRHFMKRGVYCEIYWVIFQYLANENNKGGVIGSIYKSTWTLALALGNIDSVNTTMWVTMQLWEIHIFISFCLFFWNEIITETDVTRHPSQGRAPFCQRRLNNYNYMQL